MSILTLTYTMSPYEFSARIGETTQSAAPPIPFAPHQPNSLRPVAQISGIANSLLQACPTSLLAHVLRVCLLLGLAQAPAPVLHCV